MPRQTLKQKATTAHPGLLRARYYKGIYSRVARKIGVSPSMARRVGRGIENSERIMTALIAECRRIERQVERKVAA